MASLDNRTGPRLEARNLVQFSSDRCFDIGFVISNHDEINAFLTTTSLLELVSLLLSLKVTIASMETTSVSIVLSTIIFDSQF